MKMICEVKSKKISVEINVLNNFTRERIVKINNAVKFVESVLNSVEFKEQFLNLQFKGIDSGCNASAYCRLMSGESDYGGADGDLDLSLTYYYRGWSRVVGYGLPGSIKTWVNGKYFDYLKPWELAGHLVHEYMHKLGFDDDWGSKSVPYQTGDLVERLGLRINNSGQLTPIEVDQSA